jgi:hypothetical protein
LRHGCGWQEAVSRTEERTVSSSGCSFEERRVQRVHFECGNAGRVRLCGSGLVLVD